MGMDVKGRKPVSETGKYFRNSTWWWHPLASYCVQIAPTITTSCKHWYTNDFDGLDGEDARALADALEAEVASGRCQAYAMRRDADIAARASDPLMDCKDLEELLLRVAMPADDDGVSLSTTCAPSSLSCTTVVVSGFADRELTSQILVVDLTPARALFPSSAGSTSVREKRSGALLLFPD
jgi:hypothetical protein